MEDQPTYIGGKSGRGATHGVVSELTAFLDVEPGKADELREGLKRFHIRVRNAPWDVVQKIGIVDMKHVVFDDGTRLCWNTAFDTDWDPYLDDAIEILGLDSWTDWLQYTAGYVTSEWDTNAKVKHNLQAAQVPATGSFYRAIPDLTLTEVKKAQRARAALEQVLDDPAGVEALQHPALKPLLDEAAY